MPAPMRFGLAFGSLLTGLAVFDSAPKLVLDELAIIRKSRPELRIALFV